MAAAPRRARLSAPRQHGDAVRLQQLVRRPTTSWPAARSRCCSNLPIAVCNLATPNVYGFNQTLLVLAGEHTAVLADSGWSRRQVQEFCDSTRAAHGGRFSKRAARLPGEITPDDETTWRYVMRPSRRPAPRVCGAAGPAAGRPACRAGAIGGPRVLPSRLHEPQEERHAAHSPLTQPSRPSSQS